MAALIGAGLVWRAVTRPDGNVYPIALVSMGGRSLEPCLSPDGSRVVFKWIAPNEQSRPPGVDRSGLYVKLIGGEPPRRLTYHASDRRPAWSPDSRYIAFLRDANGRSMVMLIPSIGGPERALGEADCDADFSNLSWTPDAKWLVLSVRESPQQPYGVSLLSVETGELRRLLLPPPAAADPNGWSGDFAGTLSADGRSLPFARVVGSWQFRFYLQKLTADFRPEGEPFHVADRTFNYFAGSTWASGSTLVFSAGANSRLWQMRLGGSPRLLNWAPPVAERPSVSHHRLVYNWFTGGDDLWRLDLRTGNPEMIVASRNWQTWPQYSPDGRSDWSAFLGPAPKRPWDPERFFRWRRYWEYSGGIATDLFVHRVTRIIQSLGLTFPEKAVAAGGKFAFPDSPAEIPDTLNILLDYPEGLTVQLISSMGNDTPVDHLIRGHKATLQFTKTGFTITPQKLFADQVKPIEHRKSGAGNLELHHRNLINAIRKGEELHCDVSLGYYGVVAAKMGNASYRKHKYVRWDRNRQHIANA